MRPDPQNPPDELRRPGTGEASSDSEPVRRIPAELYRIERERTASQSRGTISRGRWMWEGVKAVSTAILLFLIIRTFIVEAFKIPTGSMENTLLVGDFLLVNKAVYGAEVPITGTRIPGYNDPKRQDVVVFLPPHDPSKNYVKRIVGLPGDTLAMRDKILFLNGEPQIEPYARHRDPFTDPSDARMRWQFAYLADPTIRRDQYRPTRDNWGPIVVPPGKFFALGDNRDHSEDSRYWGFVSAESIRGRPMFVYYSFARDPLHPLSWLTDIRWARIGEPIN